MQTNRSFFDIHIDGSTFDMYLQPVQPHKANYFLEVLQKIDQLVSHWNNYEIVDTSIYAHWSKIDLLKTLKNNAEFLKNIYPDESSRDHWYHRLVAFILGYRRKVNTYFSHIQQKADRTLRAEYFKLKKKRKKNRELNAEILKNDFYLITSYLAAGRDEAMQALIENHLDRNYPPLDLHQVDEEKNTFLNIAAQKNCIDGMRALLQRGAHPNTVNQKGMTPLNYTVQKHNKEAIRLLLEHGADINFNPPNGTTALCSAITTQPTPPDLSLIKFLLAQGADRYLADSHQKTPLAYAAVQGYTDIVLLLLSFSKPTQPSAQAALKNALYWAIHSPQSQNQTDIISILLDNIQLSLSDSAMQELIQQCSHEAQTQGHPQIAAWLKQY